MRSTHTAKMLLGTKQGMTQVFDAKGNAIAVTVFVVPPMTIVGTRTPERDGYAALRLGAGTRRRVAKPQRGEFGHLGNFRYVRELRVSPETLAQCERGGRMDVSVFAAGDAVSVRGRVKGRGFQGVVKRHGFHGGSRTHGQKHSEREPGSIGATAPQKVFKGMRMAGRMGGGHVRVRNLRVVGVDTERHLLMVSGAVPGAVGTLLEIASA